MNIKSSERHLCSVLYICRSIYLLIHVSCIVGSVIFSDEYKTQFPVISGGNHGKIREIENENLVGSLFWMLPSVVDVSCVCVSGVPLQGDAALDGRHQPVLLQYYTQVHHLRQSWEEEILWRREKGTYQCIRYRSDSWSHTYFTQIPLW